MFNAPTSTAPACFSLATAVASWVGGGFSALIFDPAKVVKPAISYKFLTAKGTPANLPGSFPEAIARSISSASAKARSQVTAVKQLSSLPPSILLSAQETTSTALILPSRTAVAIDTASAQFRFMVQILAKFRCYQVGGIR